MQTTETPETTGSNGDDAQVTTESLTTTIKAESTITVSQDIYQTTETAQTTGNDVEKTTGSLTTFEDESTPSVVTAHDDTRRVDSWPFKFGEYHQLGNYCLLDNLLSSITAVSPARCAGFCVRNKLCVSFSFVKNKTMKQCRLHSLTKQESASHTGVLSAGQTCWYYEEI